MMLRPPIEPMLARAVDALPPAGACAGSCGWEPKFDGWRCLAYRGPGGVYLQSRAGRNLGPYFPEVVAAVAAALPAGVVTDGELIVWDEDCTDFSLLGSRVTAGHRLRQMVGQHPAHYVVFDLLQDHTGKPLLDRPLRARRRMLEQLLPTAPGPVVLCPQTTDPAQAREWLTTWTKAGIEGVVAKGLASRYQPGRRGWLKYRTTTVTWAIIAGLTGTPSRPDSLLLGRHDHTGRLRYTGHSHPLTAGQQHELTPLLSPAGDDHPWPQPLPAAWLGQFDRPDPLPYYQVQPDLVAQIRVDSALQQHRWRHRVHHQQVRPDLTTCDVPPPP